MKIAVFQGPGIPLDVAANLQVLDQQAQRAAADSARLLIAPEMILSGYNIGPTAVAERAEEASGNSAQAVAEIARAHGIAILYGYPERAQGKVYNAVQLIDANAEGSIPKVFIPFCRKMMDDFPVPEPRSATASPVRRMFFSCKKKTTLAGYSGR